MVTNLLTSQRADTIREGMLWGSNNPATLSVINDLLQQLIAVRHAKLRGAGGRDFGLALSRGRINVYILGTFYVYLTCMYEYMYGSSHVIRVPR